jgi:anthranilate phosphoribosyltransferase
MQMDIRSAIARLAARESLTEPEMEEVMREVMGGETTPAQIGALLVALRMKGETIEEIAGAARAMRRYATRVVTHKEVVDTCGTGGDMRGTFNISTAAAFIAAGAGVTVAKHGNRAMSGAVGGADVLEALGARIEMTAEQVAAALEEVGIAFLFAPAFHPAMRHAGGPRREIGIRTIFNLLGPLSNPAGATAQLIGVFGREWVEPLAHALGRLGSRRVLVVHGEDGLDEITVTSHTVVAEWRDNHVHAYRLAPEDFGLERSEPHALLGGDARTNAEIIHAILSGSATDAQMDIALLNAAAVTYVAGKAPGIAEGLQLARDSVRSGRAQRKLQDLIEFGRR